MRLSTVTFFFFNDTATTEIYTLSLHDALPICGLARRGHHQRGSEGTDRASAAHPEPARGEDHEDALWSGGRLGAHAGGGWPLVRGHPRAHSPDRSQGLAQAAPALALPQAQGISRRRA